MDIDATGFAHRFVPAPASAGAATLLLLHGTGGDENDLLDFGKMLAPDANLLGIRGKVLEHGAPRFFRRLAEGVFDQEDLRFRTEELAKFIRTAAESYGLETTQLVAVGYSNGANIAGSLLLSRPGLLSRAVLLRAMVPFIPDPVPDLAQTPVFLGAGRSDPIAPPPETERLAALLRSAQADVTIVYQPGGHELTRHDLEAARGWLQGEEIFRVSER